jgi:GntR family transcriptional regulator
VVTSRLPVDADVPHTDALSAAQTRPVRTRGGEAPLYGQIHDLLRGRLEAGRWRVGDMLPPIPELAVEFSASIVTIRQALALLEADGVVRRQRGIGTTVVRDLTRSRWVSLPVTLKQLVETIDSVKPRVLNVRHGASLPEVPIQADERAAPAYVRMRRVHMRDDKPYCLIDLALDERIYRKRPQKYEKYPVLSIMSEAGILEGVQARQQLTIRSAEIDETHHLLIEPGAAVADVRRSIVDRHGVVIYAAVVLYPSRVVKLDMNLLTE